MPWKSFTVNTDRGEEGNPFMPGGDVEVVTLKDAKAREADLLDEISELKQELSTARQRISYYRNNKED